MILNRLGYIYIYIYTRDSGKPYVHGLVKQKAGHMTTPQYYYIFKTFRVFIPIKVNYFLIMISESVL